MPSLPAEMSYQILDSAGLLFDASSQVLYSVCPEQMGGLRPTSAARVAASSSRPLIELTPEQVAVEVSGTILGFHCADSAVHQSVARLLGHLTVPARLAHAVIMSAAQGEGYVLRSQRRTDPLFAETPDFLAVLIKNEILEHWLALNPTCFAVHASAVSRNGSGLMLAGSSGSGKSTLALLLNSSGWDLIGEDAVIVREHEQSIAGFPFAFTVKEGSLPTLAQAFPSISECPVVERPDGKRVRYLRPARMAPETELRWIVFPEFGRETSLSLERLGKTEAVTRLLMEARHRDQRLSLDAFETLCTIVKRAQVCTLRFSDGNKAVQLLSAFSTGASAQD